MKPVALPPAGINRHRQAGFTLFETILSIGILALAAAGMKTLQAGIFTTQTAARDLVTGTEIQQACAERLLGVRRQSGYASVTNTLCSTVGNVGGFGTAAVALSSTNGSTTSTASPCSLTTCTATITIAKTSGPAAPLPALTLRLSNY